MLGELFSHIYFVRRGHAQRTNERKQFEAIAMLLPTCLLRHAAELVALQEEEARRRAANEQREQRRQAAREQEESRCGCSVLV